MEPLVRLFYDCYLEANSKEHYKTSKELDDATDKLIHSLQKGQKTLFQEYDFLFMDHMVERELRLIEFIFKLILPSC